MNTTDPDEIDEYQDAVATNTNNTPLSYNFLKLADQYFAVESCELWGYLGRQEGEWYCRWCIGVECAEREVEFQEMDGSLDVFALAPHLYSNTMPITVDHWKDFDGVKIERGPNVDFSYLDPNDQRPIYSLYLFAHNPCLNNIITFRNRRGRQFDLHWTGTTPSFGGSGDDDPFELKATATFTHIDFTSEVDSEDEIDEAEIGRIFGRVFEFADFKQHPVKINRPDEDSDDTTFSFSVRFTPVAAD